MIQDFTGFLNEASTDRGAASRSTAAGRRILNVPMSPTLRKSLDSFGNYKSDKELIKDIEACGWKLLPNGDKDKTTIYTFKNPHNNYFYRVHSTGYVRIAFPAMTWSGTLTGDYNYGPLSRDLIYDPMDQLKLVLRRAIKDLKDFDSYLYTKWKESGKTFHDFLRSGDWIQKRQKAKRFGI